jgi:hypothetical protein
VIGDNAYMRALFRRLYPPLGLQVTDEIYTQLRDGVINPCSDIFDGIAIPLTQHLDNQHGDHHGR